MGSLTRQITELLTHQDLILRLGLPANSTVHDVISALVKSIDSPCRLYAGDPADSKLYFSAYQIQLGDGVGMSLPPISDPLVIPLFAASWIDFQTGLTNGGAFNLSIPASTVGKYRRLGFVLKSDASMQCNFSAESTSVGGLALPESLLSDVGLRIGWVDLECTQASPALFKTIGSGSSIIEAQVGGTSRIVICRDLQPFGSGGGASNYSLIMFSINGDPMASVSGDFMLKQV